MLRWRERVTSLGKESRPVAGGGLHVRFPIPDSRSTLTPSTPTLTFTTTNVRPQGLPFKRPNPRPRGCCAAIARPRGLAGRSIVVARRHRARARAVVAQTTRFCTRAHTSWHPGGAPGSALTVWCACRVRASRVLMLGAIAHVLHRLRRLGCPTGMLAVAAIALPWQLGGAAARANC